MSHRRGGEALSIMKVVPPLYIWRIERGMIMFAQGKKPLGILLTVCLVWGLLGTGLGARPERVAAAAYTTQGEITTAETNFVNDGGSSVTTEAGLAVRKLSTTSAAPAEGYYARYKVTVPNGGLFRLEAAVSQLGSGTASPFTVEVNGAVQFALPDSVYEPAGQSAPTVYRYQFPVVSLSAGENTVTFRVTEKRTDNGGDRYLFYLDQFMVTDTVAGPVAASPQAGDVNAGSLVKLSSPFAYGGVLYYTTDGSSPKSSASRQLYTGPIPIDSTKTIKAYAAVQGVDGPETSYTYTVKPEYTAVVEGEDYVSSNFYAGTYPSFPLTNPATWSAVTPASALAGGGKVWRVETTRALPAEGYRSEYRVWAPQAGSYLLDMVTTPLDATWASNQFKLSVNGGAPITMNTETVQKVAAVNTQLNKYAYKQAIPLQEGWNTFQVTVDQKRTGLGADAYAVYFDYFRFRTLTVSEVTATISAAGTIRIGHTVSLGAPGSTDIFYTTDGTDPLTSGTKMRYTVPIPIERTFTLKAYAEFSGVKGNVMTREIVPVVDPVYVQPLAGDNEPVQPGTPISLATYEKDAVLYYTTDGSDPKTSATRQTYSAPIPINGAMTIQAVTSRNGEYSAVRKFPYKTTSAPVVIVEAESVEPGNTNMVANGGSPLVNKNTVSGGKYVHLFTTNPPPAEGYYATYHVTVPEDGLYQLDAFISPQEAPWASRYSVLVGDEPEVSRKNSDRYEGLDDLMNRQHIHAFQLEGGVSVPVTFKVQQVRNQNDNTWAFYMDQFRFTKTSLKLEGLIGDRPYNVFEAVPGYTVGIDLQLNGPADRDYPFTYRVTDFFEQQMAAGSGTILQGARKADIELGSLPLGHYIIEADIPGFTTTLTEYAAVVVAEAERQPVEDSPFAIDAASSWYVNPIFNKGDYAKVMALTGTQWLRDRYGWSVVQPTRETSLAPASSAWTSQNVAIDSLSAEGLKLLHILMDSPTWARRKIGTEATTDRLAYDLRDIYTYAKASAEKYGSKVAAWEIWNEEEAYLTGNDESADQYAAFMKAAAIGFKTANLANEADKPYVSMGGFIRDLTPRYNYGIYQVMALENDILPYSDIYNYHGHQIGYQPDNRLTPFLGEFTTMHLAQRDRYDIQNTPGWTTESGLGVKVKNGQEMTAVQMADQARFLVTSAVEDLSLGADKHFFFMGAPLQEESVNWGMFSWTMKPRSSYSAQSALTEALGEGKYRGKVKNLPQGAKGYVFRDGEDTVLVLWSAEPATVALDLGYPEGLLTDLMGRKQTIPSGSGAFTLPLSYNPVYLRVNGDIPAAIYDAVNRVERPLVKKSLTAAQKVVLAQNFSHEARKNAKVNNAYTLKLGQVNAVDLDVYNFGDTEMSGSIGGTVEAGSGFAISPPQSISLLPGEKKTLTFHLSYDGVSEINNKSSRLMFQGSFGDETTSKTVSNIRLEEAIDSMGWINGSGDKVIDLTIKNPMTTDAVLQKVEWTLNGESGSSEGLALQVAGGGAVTFTIASPPEMELLRTYPADFNAIFSNGVKVSVKQQAVGISPVLKRTIQVDGSVNMDDIAVGIDMAQHGKLELQAVDTFYGGPADLSAEAAIHWDDQYLYITASSTDDVFHMSPSADLIWEGDGLQIAMAKGKTGAKTSWIEFGVGMVAGQGAVYRWLPRGTEGRIPGASAHVVRNEDEKRTDYEAAIPWTELAKQTGITPEEALSSLTVVVVDSDGLNRKVWYEWGSGIVRSKDPAQFRTIQLYDDTHAPKWPSAMLTAAPDGTGDLLQWAPAKDAVGVKEYRIYRNGEMIATVPAGQTDYTVTDGAGDPAVRYKVEAGDGQGNWSTDGPEAGLTVPVTGISLNVSMLTLDLQAHPSEQLTAVIHPAGASDRTVQWASEQPGVATVDAIGVVTAVAPGVAVIKASAGNGTYTASAEVRVLESSRAVLSGSSEVVAGQPFTLNLGMYDVTDSVYTSVYAQEFKLRFDSGLLELEAVEPTKSGITVLSSGSLEDGLVRVVLSAQGSEHAITDDGDFLRLKWRAKETEQTVTASVYLHDIILANGLGQELTLDGTDHPVRIVKVNKAELAALIAEAQGVHEQAVEGTGLGQYPAGSKALLLEAIVWAQAVADDPAATQAETDESVARLKLRLNAFEASAITRLEGDLNGDGVIRIGDLGLMAAAYGRHEGESDWESFRMADLHRDGRIDLMDLIQLALKL